MKTRMTLACLLFFIFSSLYAEGEILRVGVDNFDPPFVMRGANNQFHGFDISMMEIICKNIKRTCQYQPMHFDEIIESVATKKVDVAVSSIIISATRAEKVNFSLPYMLSFARFMGSSDLSKQSFNFSTLEAPQIGVEEGTVFPEMIKVLGIKDATIITYRHTTDIIEALRDRKIDLALLDDPSAIYWESQSSGSLSVLGAPINYGFGLGIAVNKDEIALLKTINEALVSYQNSAEFKRDYHKYIEHF